MTGTILLVIAMQCVPADVGFGQQGLTLEGRSVVRPGGRRSCPLWLPLFYPPLIQVSTQVSLTLISVFLIEASSGNVTNVLFLLIL
jgi:hypothetical protein